MTWDAGATIEWNSAERHREPRRAYGFSWRAMSKTITDGNFQQ
jgi:hypothetical protein